MEPWQTTHITTNLTSLLDFTVCNPIFLSMLTAKGLLSDCDLEDLSSRKSNRFEQTKLLYNILKGRVNSYEIVKEALLKTKQSGAYNILNQCNAATARASFRYSGQISYNRHDVIGKGCNNIKVYSGTFSNRNVAVKVIACDDEQDVEKVQKEIDLLILLDSHDNIVKFFHYEIKEEFVLLALERCTASLDKFMEVGEAGFGVENFDRWNISRQMGLGIEHLHKHNVIHGDLKPSNILLLVVSATEVKVKISDFGISKQLAGDKTRVTVSTNSVLGTEGWMAPELLIKPPRVCFLNDIFSLGCIYYVLLTSGEHPFGDENYRRANVVEGKSDMKPEDLKVDDDTKAGVAQLISGMIAHEPQDRFSIKDVLEFDIKYEATKAMSSLQLNDNQIEAKNMDTVQEQNMTISSLQQTQPLTEVLLNDECQGACSMPIVEQPPVEQAAVVQPPPEPPKKKKLKFGKKLERETKRIVKQVQNNF